MKNYLAVACLSVCCLSASNAYAQTGLSNPDKFEYLKEKFQELSEKYKDKCKERDFKTEIKLLHIQQGAALAGGLLFPITNYIVDVIEVIEKKMVDQNCEMATDYGELANIIGDEPDGGFTKSH